MEGGGVLVCKVKVDSVEIGTKEYLTSFQGKNTVSKYIWISVILLIVIDPVLIRFDSELSLKDFTQVILLPRLIIYL